MADRPWQRNALGNASRMCLAKPSMKSYWLRCASSAMLRRSDNWADSFRIQLALKFSVNSANVLIETVPCTRPKLCEGEI